jgi:CheY-like chemotaxis protein
MLREGARVELATTGREAIERIKTSPFDVIVSDIAMPR